MNPLFFTAPADPCGGGGGGGVVQAEVEEVEDQGGGAGQEAEVEVDKRLTSPPKVILAFQNKLLIACWWTSKFARDTLTGPAWRSQLNQGRFPHFCVFKGKCRYFSSEKLLEEHWKKKPGHRIEPDALFKKALDIRDGIHQIVNRFLERFCYMCPLLFSSVFPS
jgi:hypothetical protein